MKSTLINEQMKKITAEGHVPQNDWRLFHDYRGTAKTFVFFRASRTHFSIQPEGLWQIVCQGFMMWDIIGPTSWWSKWMCISQWHPHICMATEEHARHDVGCSRWPSSLCNFVQLLYGFIACSNIPATNPSQIMSDYISIITNLIGKVSFLQPIQATATPPK